MIYCWIVITLVEGDDAPTTLATTGYWPLASEAAI
jgi:hypothetical protein